MIKSDFSRLQSYSNLTTALFVAMVIFFVTACNLFYSKETYLNDLAQFVLQTELNCNNYSNKDWEKSDLKYRKFTTELYQKVNSELTSEDQFTIGKLKARYETIKFKENMKNTLQSIKNEAEQTVGAIDELVGGK